jgi:hypothetical protein
MTRHTIMHQRRRAPLTAGGGRRLTSGTPQALNEGGDVVLGLLGVGVVAGGEVGGDVVGQGYSPCTGVRETQ